MNRPVYLGAPALTSALGSGLAAHLQALFAPPAASPLQADDRWIQGKTRRFGAVAEPLRPFAPDLAETHQSRNNQLLWHALAQIEPQIEAALARYGAGRVAVVMGTSTSGVDESIPVFAHAAAGGEWSAHPFKQQQMVMSAPADFVAAAYGAAGLCYGVSTACTSGARALISAARLLRMGAADAVICGGVDTLSPLTINGFSALDVLSEDLAKPFSRHRNGINIGEAAAAFVLTLDADFADDALLLLGSGSGSDAHHMSSPRPDGLGAAQSFQAALKHADLAADSIGWINLHGTGTPLNDSMESRAVADVFGTNVFCTSTKPLTGHTLGAAGALEAAVLWGVASRGHNPEGRLPPQLWDGEADPDLPAVALTDAASRWPEGRRIGASASFAFGGNNSVLIIGEGA